MSQFRNNVIQTLSREAHGVPVADTNWLEQVEYSDGVGRVALVKTKAESDRDGNERWVGTGRVAYNNKGNPVKQYEPYFTNSNGWESIEIGVTPIMHYDPLSRLIQTDFPDGTHSKVELTAWKQEDYDQNDTTESTNSHYNTPTITHFDSLGRPFYVVTNDGNGNKPVTRTVLDIEGNEKRIVDALGRDVMEYKYGIHGEKAYTKSMDAGERWMLLAADEQPIYTWDSREHMMHMEFDALRRPVRQKLKKGNNAEITVGKTVYGEEAGNPNSKQNNLRGQIWKVYDQSGEVVNVKYDFKGNLLESKRQLTQEYKQTINWDVNPTLETETFTTITAYDALNRATEIQTPHNSNIPASKIMPEYDEGGLLKSVNAKLRGATEATSFVEAINYNPKGQRTRIKYGNGATTKYTYDDKTFRLTRLWTFRNGGTENLQDLNYTYDPVGNITQITDSAQEVVFFDNQLVNPSQTFEYDALYRLTKATGREHANNAADMETLFEGYPHAHTSIPNDTSALRNYTRKWKYDEVGNILKLIHCVNNSGSNWTRSYEYEPENNQVMTTTVGDETVNYEYNEHGSMKKMPHLQEMDWDFAERLSYMRRGTTKAYYNYDGSGERVRKVVEKGSIVETRLYLGGFEIYRKKNGNSLKLERETLHIMDSFENNEPEENEEDEETTKNTPPRITNNKRRIAIVETKTWEDDTKIIVPISVQRYQLSNNIESATLELDSEANIISYEEYYPYGDTSYQAKGSNVSQKRYRYTGKEKDEESGLYYYGARYYSSTIGIFISADPKFEKYPEVSPYVYCMNNPVKYIDPDGKEIKLFGTTEEKQAILDNMQKLSNDKLGMRDDGTVIITKMGGENADKYLRTGSELIRELNKKGDGARTVKIGMGLENEANPTRNLWGKRDWANATNGTGVNAIIDFLPNGNSSTIVPTLVDPNVRTLVDNSRITVQAIIPDEIILAHELIHAYDINKGIADHRKEEYTSFLAIMGSGSGPEFKEITVTTHRDEFRTVGLPGYEGHKFTENKIRKEQGLNLRGGY